MAVSALLLLGFSAGWLMFRPQKSEISRPGPTTVEEPSSPPAAEVAVPPEDVPGAGLPGLPRYPGSVRTDYKREQVGDLLVTEAEYLVTADLEPVREFYRDVFRDEDWSVGDLGFSRGEWVFFVIHGNREALVEIEERGEVVEIELELTEPPAHPKTTDGTPTPTPQPAAPQPPPQPVPQRPAPQPTPPAQSPPVYGDDDGYEAPDDLDEGPEGDD